MTQVRMIGWAMVLAFAPLLGACSRVVSVDPLANGLPASAQRWEGAYVSDFDKSRPGDVAMLLQMKRRGDGSYDFTLHARGPGKDLFAEGEPLDLIGRGEARLVDVGENYVAAQTRCEIGFVVNAQMSAKLRTINDMTDIARRFGAMSDKVPHSNYLGPYVYTFVRGTPAKAEAVLAVDSSSMVTEAAAGTSIDVDKWEAGVGDGLLLGAGMIFESDDIHLANHGAPAEAGTFFAHLAQKVFAANEPSNHMTWTRVEPDRLSRLRLSDRFPARGRIGGWCNLAGGMSK